MSTRKDADSTPASALSDLDDVDLLELVRGSSTEAYAVLYDRYAFAARRLARHLGQREEAEDVVSESFVQVLDLLNRGKGPNRAFRAYLFTTIRHECGRRAKASRRVIPTGDESTIDTAVPFGAGDLDGFETSVVRAAYESLPERWRTVLWHLDVEGRQPHELAPLLGMNPNSVSALVYRARSGLREAYLHQHVKPAAQACESTCGDIHGLLAGVVRRTAGRRDEEKVHAHLPTCENCMAIYLDLEEVNRDLGDIGLGTARATMATGGGVAVAAHGGGWGAGTVVAAAKGISLGVWAPVAVGALATVILSVPTAGPQPEADVTHHPVTSSSEPVVESPRAPVVAAHARPAPAPDRPPRATREAPRRADVQASDQVPADEHPRRSGELLRLRSVAIRIGPEGLTIDGVAALDNQRAVPDAIDRAAGLLGAADQP